MRDLSLHILDLAQNCVTAGATLVQLTIAIDQPGDRLIIKLADNGCGMTPEFVAQVKSPFTTTRTTRHVGLGIPLFAENAELSGGGVEITSAPGQGTTLTGTFGLSHIDRPPLGDITGTVLTLIITTPVVPDYVCAFHNGDATFALDTRELRAVLGPEVGLDAPEVVSWIRQSLDEGLAEVLPEVLDEVAVTRIEHP